MVVHCETNCNEICPTIEKTREVWKKAQQVQQRYFIYAVWWFIMKQTATVCSMVEKISEKAEKEQQMNFIGNLVFHRSAG